MLYEELAKLYEKLESTTKRLEKTQILADFLKKLKDSEKEIIYLIQGKAFPDYEQKEIGVSTQLAIKALVRATGSSENEIIAEWKKTGDLGLVTEKIVSKKRQSTLFQKKLTAEKVLENLRKLSAFEGKGTIDKKISLISELITSSSPQEAKYIIRTILEDLRVGIGTGIIRDAIVYAFFGKDAEKEIFEKVQEAYDKTADFALVFESVKKGLDELENIKLQPGKPVKVMLYLKAKNIEEGFEAVGKPAALEYKYDGFRMIISKDKKGEIKIFTRRLEDVTKQFPEVVEYAKKLVKASTFLLDGEAVGYDPKNKKYKPFQEISQRIKRKYDIEKLAKELPVEVNIFDILYYNGKSLLNSPFKERRKILEKIIKQQKWKLRLAEQIITSDLREAEKFYKKALAYGHEGIMMKNLEAIYKPGARVGYGVKIKPSENEFDLVIVKAEYGTGKRAGLLTSYTIACRSDDKLLEVGKVSTGLKEKEEEGTSFIELTNLLKPLIIREVGKEVELKPKIVITVTYQNIEKSPTYSSGYALRFPRFSALRLDRSVEDIATLKEIEEEYKKQNL